MYQPLADELRPTTLDDVYGQEEILGEGRMLRRMIESGRVPNLIFYGPSGTGKTTVANIIAADEGVRRRIDRAININEVCDVNPFGVIATIAAYNEGSAWLDALRKYLWENYEYLYRFFEQRLPQYPVLPLEGTYLVWIDCRASSIGSDATTLRLQEEQKLMVNSGTLYGPGGEGFIRLNIACPRTLLADGLERIAHVLVQNF